MADELKSRLSYQHRMELNIAAGLLPSDFRPFLEYVAELRNSFAHDLAFQLSIDNETEMLSRLPVMVRDLALERERQTYPSGVRTALASAYIGIRMVHKTMIDDDARLAVMSRSRVRAILTAFFRNPTGKLQRRG